MKAAYYGDDRVDLTLTIEEFLVVKTLFNSLSEDQIQQLLSDLVNVKHPNWGRSITQLKEAFRREYDW